MGKSSRLAVLFITVSLLWASSVSAATCTSIASSNWSKSSTWSCGHVPTSTDTVVIASGFTVNLNNNFTIAALTINAGGVIDDRGNNLTVNGNIAVNGTFGVVGGGGALIASGTNATISGTGTFADSILQIDNSATIAAGSTLNFSAGGQIDVGPNAPPPNTVTLNIAGTVTGTGQTAGNTILNGNGFSSINITGSINAPASDIALVAGDVLTNNGAVSVQTLTASNGSTWTQGANSSLTLGSTAGFQGTLNASANGNTVTFPAGVAPIIPSGNIYFNISGPTCAQVAGLTILGTGPCNGGAVSQTVTMSPTLCVNDAGIGTQPWTGLTNVGTQNNIYAQASGINGQISNYLKCTGYNFNIPAGATITGITVSVWRYSVKTMSDQAMQLVKTNVIQPTNLATLTRFPKTNTQVLYGGATNLWGNTWTVADINNAGFGAAFSAVRGPFNSTDTAFVDYMPISVTYTTSSRPDHLIIQSAAAGLTCAANTLTVVACQNAACTTLYTGGVSGTLSASGPPPAVNWDGATGGAAGAGFVIPAGSSSVTKNVQVATAGVVTFGISTATPAPVNATACNFGTNAPANNNCVFTANTAGFIFSNTPTGNTYAIPAQVSGIATAANALYLRAVQATTANPAVCTPAIINSTTAVSMGYTCNNPAACQPGSLATINATAIAPGGTAVNLTFDANGSAPITVRYDDAGQITLNASKTATPFGGATAVTLNGSSNAFVIAPHHFGFSGITAAPIKAGNNFSATVTAYNGLATPTATANFGQETPAQGVTLAQTLVQPTGAGASAGALTAPAYTAYTAGSTTATTSWSEVGLITLTATTANYLGSGLSATGTSASIGPFIPDHFNTIVTHGCSAGLYTYSGQPFGVQVKAMNGAAIPAVTQNYDGTANTSPNFANAVTLSDASGAGVGTLAPATVPLTAFSAGVAGTATPVTPAYTFASRTTAATPITLRAAYTNAAPAYTVSSSGFTEGSTTVRSGRARLNNAHGSETLALPVPFRTEYWNNGWVINTADSCTGDATLGAGNAVSVTLAPPAAWAAGIACVQDSGNPGLSGAGCAAAGPVAQKFKEGATPGIGFAGKFNLWLKAPGTGNTGAVTVTGNVPTWLQYPWGGGVAINPTARATFGVYKGANEFIYLRENY